ncbi:MAG: hypothetical protein KJ000_35445, partial [Pirellulaceae bacterium]|nr:hypothetical protein [Pirellulaceae bacterium]
LTTSTYDLANQLVTSQDAAGTTTCTYDLAGNLHILEQPTGQRTTTTWDDQNRQTGVLQPAGAVTTCTYRCDGLRHSKKDSAATTKFIWDFNNYLADTDADDDIQAVYTNEPQPYGNLISQYRKGPTLWLPSYYHYDALGATRVLTDDAGDVSDTYLYDAWGNQLAASGSTVSPFRWVGQVGYYWDDAAGTFYIRARVYEPVTGRWMSQDPLLRVYDAARLDRCNFNSFAYCSSDPLNWMDASGWNRCRVKSFALDTWRCNYYKDIMDGTLTSPFRVRLEFERPCKCCEYRQYKSGLVQYREKRRGVWSDWAVLQSIGEAVEDCRRESDGRLHCYGHRDDRSEKWFDRYHDAGCKYTSYDFPGQTHLNEFFSNERGTFLEFSIELRFILNVIDTCCLAPGMVVESRIHDIYCNQMLTPFDKGTNFWRAPEP